VNCRNAGISNSQRWGKPRAEGQDGFFSAIRGRAESLVNQWPADHTITLGDGEVILALDMFEHWYHIDYGAKAAAYVDAFMRNINWFEVAERYKRASRSAQ
jgi:superoxide dismutase, Fe-Mn family